MDGGGVLFLGWGGRGGCIVVCSMMIRGIWGEAAAPSNEWKGDDGQAIKNSIAD